MILFMLLDGASYGYEISKNIRERTQDKYVMKETTLYSAFARLTKNGYIESFYQDESLGNRRTYYRITPLGFDYYQEKCAEWQVTQEVVNQFIREW
jgi:DNA-binding PadR family transcriptional regulator